MVVEDNQVVRSRSVIPVGQQRSKGSHYHFLGIPAQSVLSGTTHFMQFSATITITDQDDGLKP